MKTQSKLFSHEKNISVIKQYPREHPIPGDEYDNVFVLLVEGLFSNNVN